MYKKFLAVFLLLLLPIFASAEGEQRVFMAGETEPFHDGEPLLTLRVSPLLGADSMLLTYGDYDMMVDTGKKSDIHHLLQMLDDAGIGRHVEYLFSTHPHDDHLGGMLPLLDAGVKFDQFLTAFPHDFVAPACLQRSVVSAVKDAGIPVVDVENGDVIQFGDVEMTVLRQMEKVAVNENSAMLRIRFGNCVLLLTADVEGEGQRVLLGMHDVNADIIKLPHHGVSRLNDAFLAAVSPEFAFIPHGSADTKAVQEQLQKAGIPVKFATWGPIVIRTNGEKWIVEQELFDHMKEHVARNEIE